MLRSHRLADRRRRAARESFVEAVLSSTTIEPYDLAVARHHAVLLAHVRRAARPGGAPDLLIAATATARGRIVVTGDAGGFADLPGVEMRPTG